MDDRLAIIEATVEDQTINIFLTKPDAKYDDYVQALSWYWKLPSEYRKEWVTSWIRCLTIGLDFAEV